MTNDEKEYVESIINDDGFDYTFTGYSEFEYIEDEEFHKLRQAYLDAREKLYQYIKS